MCPNVAAEGVGDDEQVLSALEEALGRRLTPGSIGVWETTGPTTRTSHISPVRKRPGGVASYWKQ